MELTEWAHRILSSDKMEDKLWAPETLTDEHPGPAIFWKEPVRPAGMEFRRKRREEKLPTFRDHGTADNRAICLHRFAGHELLAVEMMAYTLLAFPEAPATFRRGLAHTLQEEQDHVRLYMKRLEGFGVKFGDMPLYRHFWSHTPYITTPLHYVSSMCLTLEMANLDFAPQYGKSFLTHGDQESADLMAIILRDEISHVRFGYRWLDKFKDENDSTWEAWDKTLKTTLLTPKRAKGFIMQTEPRIKAGLPEEWLHSLAQYK